MILLDTDHLSLLQDRNAPVAFGHNALVLSGNLRDFQQVPGLDVEDWLGDLSVVAQVNL